MRIDQLYCTLRALLYCKAPLQEEHMKFLELGLSPNIQQALDELSYIEPTPIQAQAIPEILKGSDVLAAAQTGTGKTGAFTLPLAQILHTSKGAKAKPNHIKSLIVTPTRELAAQVYESVVGYAKHTDLKAVVAYGGVSINPQMKFLRKGCDIMIVTPGRLLDLYDRNAVKFTQLETLVLDEADRMLDMGFIHDIKKIIKLLPTKRQNLLFSATFSEDIRKLSSTIVNNPVEITVSPRNTASETVEHSVIQVEKSKKSKLLTAVIKENNWQQVLVFTRTKSGANRLVKQLSERGLEAAAIHGNKSQGARNKALAGFKSGDVRVLVATDIVARGIDISELPNVVNYDLPNVPEDYVHRIGRTGRAGSSGSALSFVTIDDIEQLSSIQNLIQQIIPIVHVEGLSLNKPLPDKPLKAVKPKKPKKPKKPASKKVYNMELQGRRKARKPAGRNTPRTIGK